VSGAGELLDLTIDPSVIDPADPAETAATVADLVLAAIRDASRAASDLQERQLGALGGGVPGLDLSSLGLPGSGIPGAPGVPGSPGAPSSPGSPAAQGGHEDDGENDES
jgi:hypothetical protein